MKKVLIIICIFMLSICQFSVFAEVTNEQSFAYYVVPNRIYDEFLSNVIDIEFLSENSILEFPEKGGFIRYDLSNDGSYVNPDIISYLSDYKNVCGIMKDAGLQSEIHDYAFISPKYIGLYYMPLSLWLNTQDGLKFAIIFRTGIMSGTEPNLFGLFKVEILEPNEYVKRCSLRNAKVFLNGNEKSFSYAKIRYEGMEIGVRELMESIGVKVKWIENNNSLILTLDNSDNDKIIDGGLYIEFSNYDPNFDAYYMDIKDISTGNDITDNLLSKQYVLRCKFIDGKMVVNDDIANFLLHNFLYTNDNKMIDIDSNNNIISINY